MIQMLCWDSNIMNRCFLYLFYIFWTLEINSFLPTALISCKKTKQPLFSSSDRCQICQELYLRDFDPKFNSYFKTAYLKFARPHQKNLLLSELFKHCLKLSLWQCRNHSTTCQCPVLPCCSQKEETKRLPASEEPKSQAEHTLVCPWS